MKRFLIAVLTLVLVAGCGFQLRGSAGASLPYKSLYIALPENSEIGLWLARYIKSSGSTQLKANPKDAEAILQQLLDNRSKSILSLNAQGAVREYRLEAKFAFRVIDPTGKVLVAPSEINLTRDLTYNASAVLAKDQEETLLWRDINMDLANQILRQLAIAKPGVGVAED
ncbi:MAG: hypothetical protein JNK96_03430 [Betaproteobacteria bacterium]|jgi:LPS-assembly lipoprotein|nr:hypothetical protein [Betaproteobacteria bacterium]HMV22511.1 LPS assembly lipoprotein LptE [Rhodocyclaceae bacterium]HNE42867.1 LPS assembly lipoprotein LptE [Rhodocyclaceae bacterium]HNL23050.1 LPS assembly lipoprotein LptE [Rhodocyclaceae bacterium]HNM80510.1 LPS assembly lipoprotein LptE [Rhodocyclaceae bacterium]